MPDSFFEEVKAVLQRSLNTNTTKQKSTLVSICNRNVTINYGLNFDNLLPGMTHVRIYNDLKEIQKRYKDELPKKVLVFSVNIELNSHEIMEAWEHPLF